jgi:hypothetical protein
MAAADFAGSARCRIIAAKKICLAARKNAPWFCPRFAATKSHAVNVAARVWFV